jgi:hypothetical protein
MKVRARIGDGARYGLIALSWGALATTLRDWGWRPKGAVQRSYCCAHVSLATYATLRTLPAAYVALDRATRVPNFSQLLSGAGLVTGTWAHQWVAREVLGRPDFARRSTGNNLVVAVTLSGMLALFALGRSEETETADFTGRYGGRRFLTEYILLENGYLTFVSLQLVWEGVKLAREEGANMGVATRVRVYSFMGAQALAAVHMANEGVYALTRRVGISYAPSRARAIRRATLGILIAVYMHGPLAGAYRWTGQWKTHRALYDLRRALLGITGIERYPVRSRLKDAMSVGEMGVRLHQRMAEIYDGLMELDGYLEERTGTTEAECTSVQGMTPAVVADAAGIAIGIRNRRAGCRTGRGAAAAFSKDLSSGDMDYLAEVGRAFGRLTGGGTAISIEVYG